MCFPLGSAGGKNGKLEGQILWADPVSSRLDLRLGARELRIEFLALTPAVQTREGRGELGLTAMPSTSHCGRGSAKLP